MHRAEAWQKNANALTMQLQLAVTVPTLVELSCLHSTVQCTATPARPAGPGAVTSTSLAIGLPSRTGLKLFQGLALSLNLTC